MSLCKLALFCLLLAIHPSDVFGIEVSCDQGSWTPELPTFVKTDVAFNARRSNDFRSGQNNIASFLPPGTNIRILEARQLFSNGRPSGNCGLRVQRVNDRGEPEGPVLFVHYNKNQPRMQTTPQPGSGGVVISVTEPRGETPPSERVGTPTGPARADETVRVGRQAAAAIDRVNGQNRPASEQPCENCGSDNLPTRIGAQCDRTRGDHYLEDRLGLPGEDVMSPRSPANGDIDPRCVGRAQTSFPGNQRYGICEGAQNQIRSFGGRRANPKPCASESMVALTHRRFTDVMNCLGVDQQMAFSLFNHESGLIPNAVSPTGCAGPAQLCGANSVPHDVNLRFFSTYQQYLDANSQNPACGAIRNQVREPMNHNFSNNCERIGMRVNGQWRIDPVRNLFYAGISLRESRLTAQAQFGGVRNFQALPQGDREKIMSMVVMVAHNGGPGMVARASAFIRTNPGVTAQNFLERFSRYLQQTGVRRETVGFLRAVRGSRNRVENSLRDRESFSCGMSI